MVGATVLTFTLTALYGIALPLLGRATRTTQLPLGPFMLLGAFAVILAGMCRFLVRAALG